MKWLLSIALVLSPAIVFAKESSLAELIVKEKNEVHAYSGFLFNVAMVKKSPMVGIIFVKVDKTNPNNNQVKPILRLATTASNIDRDIVIAEAGAVTNFQAATIVAKHFDSDENNDESAKNLRMRFDFLDEKKRVKISEWRTEETGFRIKSVVFDKNGRVLTLSFYSKLRFNDQAENAPSFREVKIIRPNQNIRDEEERLDGLDDVENFARKLLENVFVKKKTEFRP